MNGSKKNSTATDYRVIVIGGARWLRGCPGRPRMGRRTLLITLSLDQVAAMPCTPPWGPGKGHLVREIDALGGEMARNADRNLLQVRMLNTGKGPAVQALRAQVDKAGYQHTMAHALEQEANLHLKRIWWKRSIVEENRVKGVRTRSGYYFPGESIVLAAGVYLRSEILRAAPARRCSGEYAPSRGWLKTCLPWVLPWNGSGPTALPGSIAAALTLAAWFPCRGNRRCPGYH